MQVLVTAPQPSGTCAMARNAESVAGVLGNRSRLRPHRLRARTQLAPNSWRCTRAPPPTG